jgi:hypothetical protein
MGGRLATDTLYVCEECGAAHQEEPEKCHACNAGLGGIHPIRNILRIDNVETLPAERITANDEDRQRQGFDIQTVFSWPHRDGELDIDSAIAADQDGPILRLDYASGTNISRINKGLRRRREKSILGFGIDAATGRWTGGLAEGNEEEAPDGSIKQRVVPIVQDNKNAALLRLAEDNLSATSLTTLQHALTRGLELVFQLEEGETLTEPVPSRDKRKAILMFEATEGGAGVLSRLVNESNALAEVARTALQLMHCVNIEDAVASGDPSKIENDSKVGCVKGCYRCLLSYYNQPDHELIDRTDTDARRILLRLARGTVSPIKQAEAPHQDEWSEAFSSWKLPAPDVQPLTVGEIILPFTWRSRLIAASTQSLKPEEIKFLDALGYIAILLPEHPGTTVPVELATLLGASA